TDMRIPRVLVLVTAAVMMVGVGCTKQVAGTAEPDPNKPPLSVSEDGYGIVAGFDSASAKIEIYTEPQCNHCADLQHDFGDQLAYYIAVGQLEVTYRPMTFLDDRTGGYSGQVSNALFLAAEKPAATGTQFQRFVEQLWAHQRPGGQPPTHDELHDFATKAGMTDSAAKRISDGASVVDVKDMDEANFQFLYQIDPTGMGTPTVYDLSRSEKLDIYDNDWLKKLIQS
ncbi:MAG TPA: thioredoxin domain-containing protein, partial [Mycobacterium sp.]|nr:thioredoxin domain-containing protein [Mycobacterium sp.]